MSDGEKLKPCPFCGTSDGVSLCSGGAWSDGRCYYVGCSTCDTEGPSTEIGGPELAAVAIKAWNTSPEESQADESVDHRITLTAQALRDALELANPDGPDDADQLETEVTIMQMSARISVDGDPMPAGLYAYLTDYPEEGVIGPLGAKDFSESSENSCIAHAGDYCK